MKICHLTSAHRQEDIRIFHKECVSLADAGYEVYQISCGNTYNKKGVHLIGTGEQQAGRAGRMIKTAKAVYKAAVKLDADLYHLHDPELLPYGLKLKHKGKKVIFDSHEDVPAQIMDKEWIPKPLRKIVSECYRKYETYAVKQLDAVVAATPHITEVFRERCKKVAVINNYPRLDDIEFHEKRFADREPIVCYAGGINEIRGEKIMIEAMKDVDGVLILAGDHEIMEIEEGIRYIGQISRKEVNELYGNAIAGLCILKPIENYYYSQPIKVYEYMAAGIPYICSDFPGWRKLAEESSAGICVNPENMIEIRKTIKSLLNDRSYAQEMGRNGREYIMNKCNWTNEEKKLIDLYKSI